MAEDLEYVCANLQAEFARLAGKRLLITGGAGFLGYYLVQAPLLWNESASPGNRIGLIVGDSFRRGVPGWLQEVERNPAVVVLSHDVTLPLPRNTGSVDYVMHAASIASPTYYRQHPVETMDANVRGVRTLLDYARDQERAETPMSGFLFFSSSEIYGDPPRHEVPTSEEYWGHVSCTGPRACYDESKRFGETLCVNFARSFALPVTIVRPFNNYGPGLKITDGRVLPDFARDVLSGRDVIMLSDGASTRTFCYVADAVVGYYKALVRGGRGEVYNIGVERPEVSIVELAELVAAAACDLFGYSGSVVRRASGDPEYLTDSPHRRCPVIEKARRELGYDPRITLEEGVRRSLIWYAENRHAEEA